MYTSKTRIALGRGTGESAPSCGATKTLLNDPTPNGETRHTQSIWDRYITMPVQQFLVAAGFGRTKLYDLLSSGELDSVVIGRRRLILMDSYRRLIERQRAPPLQDLKELPITAALRKPPGPKAMPPERRRRPVARAARFENTNNNAAVNSRIHQPLQGWRTRTEILDTLGRSTALKVLSLHGDWRLIDLFDGQPTIIVKVSAGVPGARACVRIGELIEAGVRSRASRTGSRRCQQAR